MNLESNFSQNKKKTLETLLHVPFSKAKKSFFFSNFSRTNQTQTKSKSSFLLIFLLKIAFKPNKSQESQVSSQDHHNQNGENPLKEESIQHWASNFPFYFLYFLIILLFLFFHLVLLFFVCFNSYFLLFIWSYSSSFLFFFVRFGWRVWPKTLKDFKNHGFLIHGD